MRETPFFETSEYSDYDFPQDLEGRSHFETVIAALKHSHEYFLRMEEVPKKKRVLPRCDNQEFMTDWAAPMSGAFYRLKRLVTGRDAERRLTSQLIGTYEPIKIAPLAVSKRVHAKIKKKEAAAVFSKGIDFAHDFNESEDEQEL